MVDTLATIPLTLWGIYMDNTPRQRINKLRGKRAYQAMKLHRVASAWSDDRVDAAVDLVANILHWADGEGVQDPEDRILRIAVGHWKVEREVK